MDSNSKKYTDNNWVRLVVAWWNKPPIQKSLNVYRVIGDVDFNNGKVTFRLEQTGDIVTIDSSQLFNISAVDLSDKHNDRK